MGVLCSESVAFCNCPGPLSQFLIWTALHAEPLDCHRVPSYTGRDQGLCSLQCVCLIPSSVRPTENLTGDIHFEMVQAVTLVLFITVGKCGF